MISKISKIKGIENYNKLINNTINRDFLVSINKVFLYKALVYVILTVILVLTARNFTAAQYGRTGVINNLAFLMFVPMILGVHSSMYKFLPISNKADRNELMIISALGSFISISLFSVFLLLAKRFFIAWLNITMNEWHMVIILTVFVSLSTISESYLRGQEKFDAICIFKLISTLLNLIAIAVFYFVLNIKNIEVYVFSLIVSHMVFTILAVIKLGIKKTCKIRWTSVKKVYIYGLSNILSMSLGGLTLSSDLFFVNYFCNASTVGHYNAYQGFMKNIFSVLFYEIFLVVFLPFLAKSDNKHIKKAVSKYIPILIITVFLGAAISTIVFICLFGKSYELNLVYIVISSLGIAIYTVYQIYVYLYNIEGSKRAMITGLSTLMVLPFTLGLQYYLTKNYNMTGALISVVLTNIILIMCLKVVNSKTQKSQLL